MKIYITAPIYYRQELKPALLEAIRFLKKEGHQLLSDDILETPLEEALSSSQKIQTTWFETWRKYISAADLAVAEISYLGTVNVGFEIASILSRGMPVIGLYQEGKDPVFLGELHSSRLIKVSYGKNTPIKEALAWALEEAKQMISRRFTFFIPPSIDNFLEELYRKKGISKSEFIRSLIGEYMQKNKEVEP